jgi:hypothetical protein
MASEETGRITEAADSLITLSQLLAGCQRFGNHFRMDCSYEPCPESNVARELAEDASREQIGDWLGSFASSEDTHARATMYLHYTEDLLLGLSKLLVGDPPKFGLIPLARSSLEASARAWWLLEPHLPYKERVIRGIAERLVSRKEEEKALEAAFNASTEPIQAEDLANRLYRQRRVTEEIVGKAGACGLEVKWPRGNVRVGATIRPSSAKVISQLLSRNFESLSPVFSRFFLGDRRECFLRSRTISTTASF